MTDKDNTDSLAEQEEVIEVEAQDYIERTEKSVGSNQTSSAQLSAKPRKPVGLWLLSLFNLLLILVAVAAGYWFWMQWNNSQQNQTQFLAEQRAALQVQQDENAKLQALVQREQSQFSQTLSSLQQELEIAQAQAAANAQNLADISGRRPSDWLIAEADYLVRMAGRKLWLEHDVNTAILMLQSADSRLQDLADPSVLPIRQRIAADVQSLQQINSVSLTSIALALSAMLPQVDNLSLALPQAKLEGPKPEELTGFDRLWAYLKSNLQYQPNTQPIAPVLNEQQKWLVREQLKFALQQAQTAVLQEHNVLFSQSLQRALGILVSHYDLENETVSQFVGSLNNLEQTNIERVYPDQLLSAQPLKDLLNKRVKQVFNQEVSPL